MKHTLFYAAVILASGWGFAIEPKYSNKTLLATYTKFISFSPNLAAFRELWVKKQDMKFI